MQPAAYAGTHPIRPQAKGEHAMRFKRMLNLALLLVLVASGFAVGLARSGQVAGQDAASPAAAGPVLPPDAEIDGHSLAEWGARQFQWMSSIPDATNPYFDQTGEHCGYGQSGDVFFLASSPVSVERACTVTSRVAIFVPILVTVCDTVQPPPFFGRDEAAMAKCAVRNEDNILKATDLAAGMELAVDGQVVPDLQSYRVTTPLFALNLPADNMLATSVLVGSAVGNGYQVLLAPLSEGDHTIVVTAPVVTDDQNELVVTTYRLTVVAPRGS
jgi:hypothetical protein